jgi:hypothetical protein
MVEICTGGKVVCYFAVAGSGDPVQTNGLRLLERWRYASKAAVFCAFRHMRKRVAKFNIEKITPQDLDGAAGPPDEET